MPVARRGSRSGRAVRRLAVLAMLGAALPSAAQSKRSADAAESGLFGSFTLDSSQEPIKVTADQLEFDYKQRVVVYRGGVQVVQGGTVLRSRTLTIRFDERAASAERLREIVAEGEVYIAQGERSATGGRAVFDQQARTITLSDNAVLHDGPSQVAGERVVVYLAENRSVVEGGRQRVRAVLQPPEKSPPASRGPR